MDAQCQLCQQIYLKNSMGTVHMKHVTSARRIFLSRMYAVEHIEQGMRNYVENLSNCHELYVHVCTLCTQFVSKSIDIPKWYAAAEKKRYDTQNKQKWDPQRVNVIVQRSSNNMKKDCNKMRYRPKLTENDLKRATHDTRRYNTV